MTDKGQQMIIDYLKSLQSNQPFTIEDLMRTLGEEKGEPWSMFETEHIEEIENFLIEQNLIIDTGKTTKLYNTANKVKTL